MRLKDRTAIVTGGGTGIGLAVAGAFVAEGARVAIASRDTSRLTAVAADLDPEGERVMALHVDVTDRTTVARGVEAVVGRWGPIQILVNNAGTSGITAVSDPDDRQDVLEECDVAKRLERVVEEVAGVVLVLSRGKNPKV